MASQKLPQIPTKQADTREYHIVQRFVTTLKRQCITFIKNTCIDCFIVMTLIFLSIGGVKQDFSPTILQVILPFEIVVLILCIFTISVRSVPVICAVKTANNIIKTHHGLTYCPEIYLLQEEQMYYEDNKKFSTPVGTIKLKSEDLSHNSRITLPKDTRRIFYNELSTNKKYQLFVLANKYIFIIAI